MGAEQAPAHHRGTSLSLEIPVDFAVLVIFSALPSISKARSCPDALWGQKINISHFTAVLLRFRNLDQSSCNKSFEDVVYMPAAYSCKVCKLALGGDIRCVKRVRNLEGFLKKFHRVR